jgi:hypothetical protein
MVLIHFQRIACGEAEKRIAFAPEQTAVRQPRRPLFRFAGSNPLEELPHYFQRIACGEAEKRMGYPLRKAGPSRSQFGFVGARHSFEVVSTPLYPRGAGIRDRPDISV